MKPVKKEKSIKATPIGEMHSEETIMKMYDIFLSHFIVYLAGELIESKSVSKQINKLHNKTLEVVALAKKTVEQDIKNYGLDGEVRYGFTNEGFYYE